MHVNNRLLSFGLDPKTNSFFIRTTDPEYLKILFAEEGQAPINEIVFDLDENFLKQMLKYYYLYKQRGTLDGEEFI